MRRVNDPLPRRVRLADNERRFREINDRLSADLEAIVGESTDEVRFVCECGSAACADPVELTIGEYARWHEDPMRFVVAPGHEIADVEDVVETNDRYTVVRKHEDTRHIVENR
jgi:hypothetical protein